MSTNVSKSFWTKWGIVVALTVLCLLIPTQGIYTPEVKRFLAITVFGLALAAFELVPTMFISVVMPAAWVLFKVAPASVVMSPWPSSTFLMIFGAFFMSATLESCGLLKRVAYYLMCKVKGSYFALLLSFFFVGILLNILTSGRAYLIMAPLALGLCASLNGVGTKLGCGLAAAVMLGSCQSHTYTFQATGWALYYNVVGDYISTTDITALSVMLHNWPMMLVGLFTLWIVSKWYKPTEGLGEITYFKEELVKMGQITKREKVNAVMLAILLVFIFTVNLHHLDVNIGFAIIPWLVYLPGLDGADASTMKRYNYDTIFFIAACMAIGTVASSLGLGAILGNIATNLMSSKTGIFGVFGLIFAICFVLNFFMTPMAIVALIAKPMAETAVSLGYSPIAFMYAINNAVEAILLPYEYVPYLIVFGFGMMKMGDFIKFSAVRSLLFLIGYIGILVPYWMLIGLL